MPVQKPGRSVQEVQTPLDFILALKTRLGITDFDMDLAASEENRQAICYYDEDPDSLTQPWEDFPNTHAWLNPPYARIEPWVKKAYESTHNEGPSGFIHVLIPAAVGSNWWRDWVDGKCEVLLLNGRLTFVGHPTPYPKDLCLLTYGKYIVPSYSVWDWRKT